MASYDAPRSAFTLRGTSQLAIYLHHGNGAVIVAVVAVRMVQTAIDQIIEMVAVRHLLVAATLVFALAGGRSTVIRVRRVHRQDVLIVMILVRIVQTAIVQIVNVAIMLDACVSAVLAVDMLVVFVDFVSHRPLLLQDRVAECIGSLLMQTIGQNWQTGMTVSGRRPPANGTLPAGGYWPFAYFGKHIFKVSLAGAAGGQERQKFRIFHHFLIIGELI